MIAMLSLQWTYKNKGISQVEWCINICNISDTLNFCVLSHMSDRIILLIDFIGS